MKPRQQMSANELSFWQHHVTSGMALYAVCLRNAVHSDGRRGDAYLGTDLDFSTLDPLQAQSMYRYEAERYAKHWQNRYRGFYGGARIEVVPL